MNNAGVTKFVKHNDLDGLDAADFLRIYSVNVVAGFQMIRACRPEFEKAGPRRFIVNVSSIRDITGNGFHLSLHHLEGCAQHYDAFAGPRARAGHPHQYRSTAFNSPWFGQECLSLR